MKALKFNHDLAQQILEGRKTTTFRIFDDKDISVNDEIELIDKVGPDHPETWKVVGVVRVEEVIQKRLGDLSVEDMEGHERYRSKDELLKTFQHYYGKRVTTDTPIKIVRFSLLKRGAGMAYKAVKNTANFKELTLYADGGSRGNPGPSASGFVLLDASGDIILRKGVYLGVTTNNQAEYQSLKLGLTEAKRLQAQELLVYMDSQLVIKQMQGVYKVKNRDLWPIYTAIKDIVTTFKKVTFKHVPRELNKLADGAVNEALDEALRKEAS